MESSKLKLGNVFFSGLPKWCAWLGGDWVGANGWGRTLLAYLPFLHHGSYLGFFFSPLTSLNTPCAEPLLIYNLHFFSSPHTHSFINLAYSFYFYLLLCVVSAVCTLLPSIYHERGFFIARCLYLTAAHLRSYLFLALWVSFSNSEL